MARRLILAVMLVGAALGAWAFWLEPRSLRAEVVALTPPDWPKACDGLRVAVIADLHAGAPFVDEAKLDATVQLVVDASPALVLLAGDYVIQGVVGGTFMAPEDVARHLEPLARTAPVLAVLGNHDWWLDGPRVREALESAGITVIDNAGKLVTAGDCRVWVAGIGDLWEGKPDVDKAVEHAPDAVPIIALTHNPDVFPRIPPRVALTIAGHTHGGQVALPIIGRPVVPSAHGERFAVGHIVEDGRHLFVSTGVGTSIAPVRFRVPPLISVLALGSGQRQIQEK